MIIFTISTILLIATIAIHMAADDEARKTRELLEDIEKMQKQR